MKLNTSPMDAPSSRRRNARSNRARSDITIAARRPPQLAGESRNRRVMRMPRAVSGSRSRFRSYKRGTTGGSGLGAREDLGREHPARAVRRTHGSQAHARLEAELVVQNGAMSIFS